MLMLCFIYCCIIYGCADLVLYTRSVCVYSCGRRFLVLHFVVLIFGLVFCDINLDFHFWRPPWGADVWLDCFDVLCHLWELLQYIFEVGLVRILGCSRSHGTGQPFLYYIENIACECLPPKIDGEWMDIDDGSDADEEVGTNTSADQIFRPFPDP